MRRCAVLVLGLLLLAGSAESRDWYSRGHGRSPQGNRVYVCHGYMCRIVTPVTFSAEDLGRIAVALKKAAVDAAKERTAISRAVQEFEAIVGARLGTSADLPGMQFGRGDDDQMDCIDEATNTTSLLRLLASHDLLKHHRVLQPSARGFFLDGRYPHATAVLAEKAGGEKWAIDSWPKANGEPPVVQPLSEWMRTWPRGRARLGIGGERADYSNRPSIEPVSADSARQRSRAAAA
jgi:hypothetical protein